MSKVEEIGTIPLRLTKPIVGFSPTTEFWLAGDKIEPAVSLPIVAAAKLTEVATPLPELEPPVSKTPLPYGFKVWPPTAEYPLGQSPQKK